MPAWTLPFLAVLASAVAAPFASKMASAHISPSRAGIFEAGATFLTIAVVALASRGGAVQGASFPGVAWAVLAGVLWTGYTLGIYYMFAAQAPVGVSLTALRAATIVLTALAAAIFLGEDMSRVQLCGVVLSAVGVVLVTSG